VTLTDATPSSAYGFRARYGASKAPIGELAPARMAGRVRWRDRDADAPPHRLRSPGL